MQKTPEIEQWQAYVSSLGGRARMRRMSAAERQAFAMQGVRARQRKRKMAAARTKRAG